MPRRVAAGTSIVSTPVPARAITRKCGARVNKSAVTRVSDRTISACALASALSSSSLPFPATFTTSMSPCSASSRSPPSDNLSATTTRQVTG